MSKLFLYVHITCFAFILASAAVSSAAGPDTLGCASMNTFGEITTDRIPRMQRQLSYLPVGERIATWADSFLGTQYDVIPVGLYVETQRIVCDSKVDCMYLVFRATELGTTKTPEEARERALELRFITKGVVKDGKVVNYDERFQYAEDMIASGKWGSEITGELGETVTIPGSRGRDEITILPKDELLEPGNLVHMKDGDLIFFVKDPSKRVVGEVIGHLGVIKVDEGVVMLIHASGSKRTGSNPGGGKVKKVPLMDYVRDMGFIGAQLTRFEE